LVEEAWKLAINAQDHQQALAGAPPGTPSVCQLPSGPSLKIDPQTREVVSHGFCLMLFYQIYNIDYAPNYTYFKLKISTIRGWLADAACLTVLLSFHLDVLSEPELWIQDNKLRFDNAHLSKVVEGKQAWFTRMDVLDLIFHQFFFTANSLGCQPMTSQYCQPLAVQTLAQVAAAIYCALSQHAMGTKATVMFSQDEYRGTFCPSPLIKFTPEATALINDTLLVCFKPPLSPPPHCTTPLG